MQWLSASGDERFVPLFREILAPSARLEPSFFDGGRHASGGFSAKFYERLGLEDGAPFPQALRPRWRAGSKKRSRKRPLA